ncbi:LysR family transcriptional regulator [Nonomuraea rhizosphaerae]|uniref:LysR family transcriptional regulator n=1 Tax=Nonomuraea rhizosphaerae TaxID=2665663 RepID=UPI001C5EEF53|nr:LysR family transcriptional regulator [Nonomuraea rhizosphaerae]
MERQEIEAFLTLAQELHFGRTAERLRVTTARVSQTIRKLERRVGAPLFERTSRRVALTPLGVGFVAELRPAYEGVEAALANAVRAGRGVEGELRVGFVGAAAGQLLLRVVEVFGARRPGCVVSVREVQMGGALERLREGEVELLLGCFPVEVAGLVAGPVLLSERRMLAVPASSVLAGERSVSIEALAGQEVLRAPCSIPDYWSAGRPGPVRRTPGGRVIGEGREAATLQEVLTLIGAGKGVFPVGAQARQYYARPDVVYVPFSDTPPLEWGLVWRAGEDTALVRAFVAAARECA